MGVEIRVFAPPQTQPSVPPRVDIGMLPPCAFAAAPEMSSPNGRSKHDCRDPNPPDLARPHTVGCIAMWQELNVAQWACFRRGSPFTFPGYHTTKRLWLDEMPIEIWNKKWIQLRNLQGILFQWKVSVPLSFAPWPSAQASTSHCRGNCQSCEAWDLDTTGTIRWIFSAFQSWKSHLVVPPFLEGWWWFLEEGLGDFLSFEKENHSETQ